MYHHKIIEIYTFVCIDNIVIKEKIRENRVDFSITNLLMEVQLSCFTVQNVMIGAQDRQS